MLVNNCPVAVLGSGETFGELGLQNLENRTASVKASFYAIMGKNNVQAHVFRRDLITRTRYLARQETTTAVLVMLAWFWGGLVWYRCALKDGRNRLTPSRDHGVGGSEPLSGSKSARICMKSLCRQHDRFICLHMLCVSI